MKIDNQKIWKEFLVSLNNLNKMNLITQKHLENIKIVDFKNNFLYLMSTNNYSIVIFRKIFLKEFNFFLEKKEIRIEKIIIRTGNNNSTSPIFVNKKKSDKTFLFGKTNKRNELNDFIFSSLNQKKTLFLFLKPSFLVNNLLILGAKGLGKTYLANSINNYVKKIHQRNSLLISCEFFFLNLCNIYKEKKYILLSEIKKILIELDFLIIDDFDFIFDKKKIKTFLFTILNIRVKKNKKNVFLINNHLPTNLKKIPNDFVSAIKINLPTFNKQNCKQILKNFVDDYNFKKNKQSILSNNLIEFITKLKINNIYELINIYKVISYLANKFNNNEKKIIDEFKTNIYMNLFSVKEKKTKNFFEIERLIKKICSFYKIKYNVIFEKKINKKKNFVKQIITYFLREDLELTFKKIAFFLKRDHSTIVRNFNNIKKKNTSITLIKIELKKIKEWIEKKK